MPGITPGNFTSSIDTGLPVNPQTQAPEETKEDLVAAFSAIQILQREIDTIKARLTAAGIP